jgi:predicted  nucleic acid-binding Zn-ribbon protein
MEELAARLDATTTELERSHRELLLAAARHDALQQRLAAAEASQQAATDAAATVAAGSPLASAASDAVVKSLQRDKARLTERVHALEAAASLHDGATAARESELQQLRRANERLLSEARESSELVSSLQSQLRSIAEGDVEGDRGAGVAVVGVPGVGVRRPSATPSASGGVTAASIRSLQTSLAIEKQRCEALQAELRKTQAEKVQLVETLSPRRPRCVWPCALSLPNLSHSLSLSLSLSLALSLALPPLPLSHTHTLSLSLPPCFRLF